MHHLLLVAFNLHLELMIMNEEYSSIEHFFEFHFEFEFESFQYFSVFNHEIIDLV